METDTWSYFIALTMFSGGFFFLLGIALNDWYRSEKQRCKRWQREWNRYYEKAGRRHAKNEGQSLS